MEATKFTEVGYVGRDVEQIIRDLVESAIHMIREKHRKDVQAKAELMAEERVIDALVGENASEATRTSFRQKLRTGELDDKEDRAGSRRYRLDGLANFRHSGLARGADGHD